MKKDILIMWALWNSLWLSYEFHNRPFDISAFNWHWDDDISQALMLAETILQCPEKFDSRIFLDKLIGWYKYWYDSLKNYPEWIWFQTRELLEKAEHDSTFTPRTIDMSWKHLDWNGSLMRVWPAAMVANWNIGAQQSRVTHNTILCNFTCEFFVDLLHTACVAASKEWAMIETIEWFKEIYWDDMPNELYKLIDWWYIEPINKPSWYVIDTLHAVLNTFIHTTSPMEWFEYIINLWWDTDTTACIYWYLAWAYYWIDDEVSKLIDKIEDIDYIKYLSRKLVQRSMN